MYIDYRYIWFCDIVPNLLFSFERFIHISTFIIARHHVITKIDCLILIYLKYVVINVVLNTLLLKYMKLKSTWFGVLRIERMSIVWLCASITNIILLRIYKKQKKKHTKTLKTCSCVRLYST